MVDAAPELRLARTAVADALGALRVAGTLAWSSTAGDLFRDRLADVVTSAWTADSHLAGCATAASGLPARLAADAAEAAARLKVAP